MASKNFDVVIAGASFGGVAAALAAAADPKVTVVLLESSTWIGGQATSQGVTRWDEAGTGLIETSGSTTSYQTARNNIRAWYRANASLSSYGHGQAYFNPGFAVPGYPFAADPTIVHEVLRTMVAALAPRLQLITGETVVKVSAQNGIVQSVTTAAGNTYSGNVFLDATDLGVLLPLAGIKWTIGAEAKSDTGEADAPGTAHPEWIQPITVPIALEHRPDGEVHTIARPANFDDIARAQNFRLVDGDIDGVFTAQPGGESLFGYRQYVDSRNFADAAYATDRSTMNVGSNDYMAATLPSGSAETDAQIYAGARDVSLAFTYWLQTECPRDDGNGTGYPNLAIRTDAFGTADGCAPAAYIRESRRIDARTRIVQQNIDASAFPTGTQRATNYRESCGIGWYGIDVHAATGPGTPWLAFSTLRFQIPLGALLPKELDNFVAACKNIGTTHLTSGAYRVHPVEWAIGEAAGVLAAMCVTQGVTADVIWSQPDRLASYQFRLLARGVPLFWWSDITFDSNPKLFAAANFCGIYGVFTGEDALAFVPGGSVSSADQQTLDERVGKELPWPSGSMTRGDAAIFICEQMGWPIG